VSEEETILRAAVYTVGEVGRQDEVTRLTVMTRHWYGRQDAAASVNSTPAGLAPSPAGRTDDECRTLPLLGTSVSRTPPAPGELPSRASALNIALTAT